MSQRGTLLSAFKREKARQFQTCRKHLLRCVTALLLTLLTVFVINHTIVTNGIFAPRKPPQDFSASRECLTPDKNSALIKVDNNCIYVHSVLASFKQRPSTILSVVINAWDGTYDTSDFVCCLLVKADTITAIPRMLSSHSVESPFRAVQFECMINAKTLTPTHVAFSDSTCSRSDLNFHPITYPEQSVDQLGVCTKVAYGRLIPERLAEWFELQKILGVEKVIAYTYEIDVDSMEVLHHYENSGLLQIIPYNIPQAIKGKPTRGFGIKQRSNPQYYNDVQVAMYDCQERLQGYRYVTVSGFHEFIIPNREISNLYDLLEHRLRIEHQQAASFVFPVKTFITEWNKADPDNELFYLQYFMRRPYNTSLSRSVHVPNRIRGLTQDDAEPHYQYERITFNEDIASLHQYMPCPADLENCLESPKYHDNDLFFYAKILKDRMKSLPAKFRKEF